MAHYYCKTCQHSESVPDAYTGRSARCSKCRSAVRIAAGKYQEIDFVEDSPEARSLMRYPNLLRYLALSKIVAKIVLAVGLVPPIFGLFLLSLSFPAIASNYSVVTALVFSLACLGLMGLSVGFVVLLYLAAMASVEFVYVIIDIESNTSGRNKAL